MSTSTPFSLSTSLQPLRLLELPPELQQLLSFPSPPGGARQQLFFKSRDGTSESVLCTSDRTFVLRHVQTSNSVYVAEQTTPISTEGSEDDGVRGAARGLRAIAQCGSWLEATPAPPQSADAVMTSLLPLCTSLRDLTAPLSSDYTTTPARSRRAVFDDTPMSEAECAVCWTRLCAYELPPLAAGLSARSFRPDGVVVLQIWRRILLAARAEPERVNLATDMDRDAVENVLLLEGDDGDGEKCWPAEARTAVLLSLLVDAPTELPCEALRLDRAFVVKRVGKLVLEHECGGGTIKKEGFIQSWKDSLPEEWRADAALDLLEVRYSRAFISRV